jgi:hypothetical protein
MSAEVLPQLIRSTYFPCSLVAESNAMISYPHIFHAFATLINTDLAAQNPWITLDKSRQNTDLQPLYLSQSRMLGLG